VVLEKSEIGVDVEMKMNLSKLLKLAGSFVLLFILFSANHCQAGRYAAEFLRIGVGARAAAMGNAFVAIADDGTASYWNPAGLGNLTHHQISFTHVQLFDNLAQHNFANFSLKLSSNLGLGISWIRMAVDNIPRYSRLDGTRYDRILNPELRSTGKAESFFGDTEDALFLTFGRKFDLEVLLGGNVMPAVIPMTLSVGISYKYISQKLDRNEGIGQGLDAGILIKFEKLTSGMETPQKSFSLGVNFQDFTGTTIAWNTNNKTRDKLPFNLLFGASYSQLVPGLGGKIAFSFGRDNIYEASNHWGGEFVFKNILSLRAGMKNNDFTAGAGIKIFWFKVDYAFVSYDLGNSHRISGLVEF
jgi:hypothetical protein